MAQAQQTKKSRLPLSVKFALICVILMAGVFFPTTLIFFGCMVPTLVALLVDPQPQKTAWITVGCMNFAGTVPAWFILWENGQRMDKALDILLQSSTLIIAYGAAALGWIIYHNVTPFVAGIMVMRTEKRLKDIEKRQKELTAKWGTDVSGP